MTLTKSATCYEELERLLEHDPFDGDEEQLRTAAMATAAIADSAYEALALLLSGDPYLTGRSWTEVMPELIRDNDRVMMRLCARIAHLLDMGEFLSAVWRQYESQR